jgi:hypothetical protein
MCHYFSRQLYGREVCVFIENFGMLILVPIGTIGELVADVPIGLTNHHPTKTAAHLMGHRAATVQKIGRTYVL